MACSCRFSTLRPIEEDPDRKVAGKFLEAVDHTRWHEENVSHPKTMPLVAVSKPAGALGHYVHFVAGMRRLGIVLAWSVELDGEGAMAEKLDEPLTAWPGQSGQTLGQGKSVLRQCGSKISTGAGLCPARFPARRCNRRPP